MLTLYNEICTRICLLEMDHKINDSENIENWFNANCHLINDFHWIKNEVNFYFKWLKVFLKTVAKNLV